MTIRRVAPSDPAQLRRQLYAGEIYLLPPTAGTSTTVERVREELAREFGEPVREAQFRLSPEEFFRSIGRLRTVLFREPAYQDLIFQTMSELGFAPKENATDPLRLRVIAHDAHENPRAAAIYHVHRDTWYSHPQCQLSWWIPLDDLEESETFEFFPEYLDRPAENDSAAFDYDTWTRDRQGLKIGWQDPNAGLTALYPHFKGDLGQTPRIGFSCRAGELLLFAGAHLHQTRPNRSGRTRFSVDFRTAHLADHEAGIGAPNADNRSTGSALRDYRLPESEPIPR